MIMRPLLSFYDRGKGYEEQYNKSSHGSVTGNDNTA